MPNEVTFAQTADEMSASYRVTRDNFLMALHERAGSLISHLKRSSLAGYHSTTERFTKKPRLAATSIADGVDLTNTPYSPQFTPLTVGEVGVQTTQTDLNSTSSLLTQADLGTEMGDAIAEKLLSDIVSLGGGASASVGSSGNNLTEAQYLEGKTTLMLNRIPEPHITVLHTQQEFDLIADVGTTLTTVVGASDAGVIAEGNSQVPRPNRPREILGSLVYSFTAVPTANAGADSAGFMFGGNRAIGMVDKWMTRLESERDASLRATEQVGTSAYAVGEIDDDAIVGIITDR